MRQELLRRQKLELAKRVQTVSELSVGEFSQDVEYDNIEEAFLSIKVEFDEALQKKDMEALYLSLSLLWFLIFLDDVYIRGYYELAGDGFKAT